MVVVNNVFSRAKRSNSLHKGQGFGKKRKITPISFPNIFITL